MQFSFRDHPALSFRDGMSLQGNEEKASTKLDAALQQFDEDVLLKGVESVGTSSMAWFISSFAQTRDKFERGIANATLSIGGMMCSSCVLWHIRYLCACSGEALGYEATLTTRVSMSELGNAAVLIGGMTSNSCAISVENALENTENVMLVIGSFGTEKARICFNKDFVGI
ncbi:unnamed protein product [Peronospora belbahrii]|uniref:Beta-ketoacyl synthase N-terminal domain-containing protein n=1 Tax=Peronospora belbahrii TaxID=622444 RepID=A0AAU9LBQ7_9STRA|nr:unnamed protein product [Peronospora belbahrii]